MTQELSIRFSLRWRFWINSQQLLGLLSTSCHLISDGLSALLTNNRRTEASAAE